MEEGAQSVLEVEKVRAEAGFGEIHRDPSHPNFPSFMGCK
jgi:hypothetical protein